MIENDETTNEKDSFIAAWIKERKNDVLLGAPESECNTLGERAWQIKQKLRGVEHDKQLAENNRLIKYIDHEQAEIEKMILKQLPPPWERIPENGIDRKLVKLLHEGYPINIIDKNLGYTRAKVRLSELRKQFGQDIIPTRKAIIERMIEKS